MNRIRTVLLLGCCLLLAACSQGIGDQQQGTTPEVGNTPSGQSQQAEEQQSPAEPSDTTMEDPDPESSEEDPDHESSPSDEEEINAEPQYHMNQVYRIVPNNESVSEKVVLLTFDDGPKDETMINNMIDVLDKHDAKAIFFVNGYRVKQNPDLLKIIDDRGQIIGNHAWDHIDLKKEGPESARQQIEDVQEIVMDTVGKRPRFFRPPFGSGGDTVKKIVADQDMLFMTWSNGSLDWESKNKNKPDAVVNNVLEQLHPGSNILMHELPWTVEALDSLLTKLDSEGYGFVDPNLIETEIR